VTVSERDLDPMKVLEITSEGGETVSETDLLLAAA
jgi:hypothetical protein